MTTRQERPAAKTRTATRRSTTRFPLTCPERAMLAVYRSLSEAARARVDGLLWAEWLFPGSPEAHAENDKRFNTEKTLLADCGLDALVDLGRDTTELRRRHTLETIEALQPRVDGAR